MKTLRQHQLRTSAVAHIMSESLPLPPAPTTPASSERVSIIANLITDLPWISPTHFVQASVSMFNLSFKSISQRERSRQREALSSHDALWGECVLTKGMNFSSFPGRLSRLAMICHFRQQEQETSQATARTQHIRIRFLVKRGAARPQRLSPIVLLFPPFYSFLIELQLGGRDSALTSMRASM